MFHPLYCVILDSGDLWLRALLSEPKGLKSIFVEAKGIEPEQLGIDVARELLDERGGNELMEMVL